jgi:hypothetical protein
VEKDELLRNIRYTKNILLEIEKLHAQFRRNNKLPRPIKLKRWLIIGIILAVIFNRIYPLFSWLCLISIVVGYFYNIKVSEQRKSYYSLEDEQIRQKKEELIESVIPNEYQDTQSLNKIESYLINQRADNLKECLNLLEDERKHNEQIRNLQEIQRQNEEIYLQREPSKDDKARKLFRSRYLR